MVHIEQAQHAKERELRIVALLDSGERVTGLNLTLKLFSRDIRLPRRYTHHDTSVCIAMKQINELACCEFLYRHVMTEVPGLREGRIHICPHGLTEIAVPVRCHGTVHGVLLGGQCWTEATKPPHDGLRVPGTTDWLADRHHILLCIAGEIGRMLLQSGPANRRADAIQSFIHSLHQATVTIDDLAQVLHLSPSRTRHVVRELFGISFTDLLNAYRLGRAAELLETTGLPVGDISGLVGFGDQAYMTRLFTRRYKQSPTRWRRQNSTKH